MRGKLLRSCSIFPAPTFPLPAGALLWHHVGEPGQPRLSLSFAEMTIKTGEIGTELTHPCSAIDILVVLAPFFVRVVGCGVWGFLLLFAFKKQQKVMRFRDLHLSHLPCPILEADTGLRIEFLGKKEKQ